MSKEPLPEGYLAPNINSYVYAVPSNVVAETGEVHTNNGVGNGHALDSFIEFSIEGDSRLERLRGEAKQIGKKYSNPNSPSYEPDGIERERKISSELIERVGEEYGKYSDETADYGNKAERDSDGVLWDSTAKLSDMEKDSLICRHYAPIMSVLLHEAGIENHLVTSPAPTGVSSGILENVAEQGRNAASEDDIGMHKYVVTKSGAIVEGTVAGQEGAQDYVYKRIINGVTVEDIVYRGHAALTEDGGAYGGHGGDGKYDTKNILIAWQSTYQRYQESLAPPPMPMPAPDTALATIAPSPQPIYTSPPSFPDAPPSAPDSPPVVTARPVLPPAPPALPPEPSPQEPERPLSPSVRMQPPPVPSPIEQPKSHVPPTGKSAEEGGRALRGMDANHDGIVSKDEYRTAVRKDRSSLDTLDLDGNGKVSGNEMKAALASSGLNYNHQQIGGMDNAVKNLGKLLAASGVKIDHSDMPGESGKGSGLNVAAAPDLPTRIQR